MSSDPNIYNSKTEATEYQIAIGFGYDLTRHGNDDAAAREVIKDLNSVRKPLEVACPVKGDKPCIPMGTPYNYACIS